MGRSTGAGPSGHSKAGKARRGPRVLQVGTRKEAQGRIIVLLLNMYNSPHCQDCTHFLSVWRMAMPPVLEVPASTSLPRGPCSPWASR